MKVGKATSDWNVMKCGCPQGSSFGPTLWNLYQNDLSYHINEIANLNMYADDHQMYIVGSDMSIMRVLIWKRKETLPLNGIRTTIYCPTQKNLTPCMWFGSHFTVGVTRRLLLSSRVLHTPEA